VARETDSISATSCSDRPPKYQEFHDLSLAYIERRELGERFIEHHDIEPARLGRGDLVVEVGAHRRALALGSATRPCVVDEDPSHHLRRHAVELAAVLPRDAVSTGQPHERLVHQGRRLERMVDAFPAEEAGRQLPEFVVNERHELVAGAKTMLATVAGASISQFAAPPPPEESNMFSPSSPAE
jgi:hypothetical protein